MSIEIQVLINEYALDRNRPTKETRFLSNNLLNELNIVPSMTMASVSSTSIGMEC